MKKHTYTIRYRYRDYHPGATVELTEDEATRLDNEAPGVCERTGPAAAEHPPKPAPKVTAKEEA